MSEPGPLYTSPVLPTDETHICPMCGDAFYRREDMKNHHAQSHGISLAGELTTCAHCGTEFAVNPARLRRSNNLFCPDSACYGAWMAAQSPEGSNRWNGGLVETECAECGALLERNQVHINRSEHHFCDPQCHGKWKQGTQTGEDNPSWRGGHRHDYGANWHDQRETTIQRDDEQCHACGMTREEHHEEYGRDLHVHHIVRKEAFRNDAGELDYERANDLQNLVTLCTEHHYVAERMAPLFPFPK